MYKTTGEQRGIAGFLVIVLAGLLGLTFLPVTARGAASDAHIRVDQFGYRRYSRKVAVLREPVTGYDAPNPYTPSPVMELRRATDDRVVFSGNIEAWNNGAEHSQSGDKAWWFDFSIYRRPGEYYIYDPLNGISSETFRIADDVYDEVLQQALRVFYYQRCGTAKQLPYAEGGWTDSACHLGPHQDTDCRLVTNPDPSTSRDLSGGWHDAGDYNKYINYADATMHSLLDAYEYAPDVWTDDINIPESGNGIPDILDEMRWELEWFLKMQTADGSVLHKLSVAEWGQSSPPSSDPLARYYAPPTASATISACAVFAHAALVYEGEDDPSSQAFGMQMRDAALAAWGWLEANPSAIPSNYDNAGFLTPAVEDSPYEQEMNMLGAAAFLYELTGDTAYRDWVDTHYLDAHLFQWGYVMAWEETAQRGLLRYARNPQATPDVAAAILDEYQTQMSGPDVLGKWTSHADPYQAYLQDDDYNWGSNWTKADVGDMYLVMLRLNLDPANKVNYKDAAEGYLHYLHGVNPPGYVYLTNMSAYGAENSVREMYHEWFGDGTDYDNAETSLYGPAPGYLTGGANPTYSPDGDYQGPPIEPPMNQPAQKSYYDWNTDWPENSWEVTEPAIYYQAGYLRLLAQVSGGSYSTGADGDNNNAEHPACCVSLGYLLQPELISTQEITDAGYDYLILEPTRDGKVTGDFTPDEIEQIRNSGPVRKIVLAYLSIGEAEDYRDYWDDSWVDEAGNPIPGVAPEWLDDLNPDWPGNYKVRYWMPQWQALLFGTPGGENETPLDRIIDQGFDGVYLDIVEGYYYWSEDPQGKPELPRAEARSLMIDLVQDIADYARNERGATGFMVFPQNAAEIIQDDEGQTDSEAERYFSAIDGIGIEDLYYNGRKRSKGSERRFRLNLLRQYHERGKTVLVTDYVIKTDHPTVRPNRNRVRSFYKKCRAEGFVPYAANDDRALDELITFSRAEGWPVDQPVEALPDEVDLNSDGVTDDRDLAFMLLSRGECSGSCPGDIYTDGVVDESDLRRLLLMLGYNPDTYSGGKWRKTMHSLYREVLLPFMPERSRKEQRLDKRALRRVRKAP